MPPFVRAFVAVRLDDATRAAIASASANLRAHAGDLPVSWVAPDNFHITLKFLGGVDEGRVGPLAEALREAALGHRAFSLEVAGLGAFPSAARPRVLWAGVASGREPLTALADSVERAMASQGFPREDRAFSAHVTLGRVREPRRAPALAAALTAGAFRPLGRVSVEAVALMRSDLSPRGARYRELARLPLAR
jgi:2'-5' RNA ligase